MGGGFSKKFSTSFNKSFKKDSEEDGSASVKKGVVPEPYVAVMTPRVRERRMSMPMTEEESHRAKMLMRGRKIEAHMLSAGKAVPAELEKIAAMSASVRSMGSPLAALKTEKTETEQDLEIAKAKRRIRRASLSDIYDDKGKPANYCKICRFKIPDDCLCIKEVILQRKREEEALFRQDLARFVVPHVHSNRNLKAYAKTLEESPESKMADMYTKTEEEQTAIRRKKKALEKRREIEEENLVDLYISKIGDAMTGKVEAKEHVAKRLNLVTHKMGD
mmetsp:Transcript_38986/g.76212  ORF Transcript_38986/g.76212 Transcript_38986/m.76212 type:complete len:276 (+) Transcript_38986:171-998(+)